MTWLNEVTAVPALLLWLLVFRGFWPHLRLRGNGPLHYMVQGVSLVAIVLVCRLAYWDIARPLARAFDLLPPLQLALTVSISNSLFNIAASVAGYLILVGLHSTLPAGERRFYTPFTAPFYPNGILFFKRDRQ